MKNTMKRTVLPRLLALLFALILTVTATVLPTAAAKGYTEWVYDEASDTLTATFPNGDEVTYLHYETTPNLRYDPDYLYKYNNTVRMDGTQYKVYAAEEGGESLALESNEDEWLFFVTEERKSELDELEAGTEIRAPHLSYREMDYDKHYGLEKTFLRKLNNLTKDPLTETVTDTLHEFRYAPRYELWLYDDDAFLAVNGGFLFDLAGEMYYLNLQDLPAAALDENGEIIPSESVTVTLYRLPADMEADAYEAVSYAYYNGNWIDVEYEAGYMDGMLSTDDTLTPLVYFTIALLGIAAPIAPIVLGLCLPHSRKQGYKKRWYLLTILGGVWMLLGILLLVLMITVL